MTAIVSVPAALASRVGSLLSRGLPIPSREVEDIGRVYLVVPLACLADTGIFNQPEIAVTYFNTREEAFVWGEADIAKRREWQRANIRALLLEGVRRRQLEEEADR